MSEPKREEVIGGWRRRHNEELQNLYAQQNTVWVIKSRRIRWEGHVACMWEIRNAHRILDGKLKGKRPLGISRRTLEKTVLQGVNWIHLGQDKDQ